MITEPQESKFAFLTSTRFWAGLIGVIALYLNQKGIIDTALFDAVGGLAAIFIGIRTTDRITDKATE